MIVVMLIRRVMKIFRMFEKFKRRFFIGVAIFLAVYIASYLGTTTVKPQGLGGLSGPLKVRVFQNERHLIVFYPTYLVERWIRNGSLFYASYYFSVDFKDGEYPHPWLYDDGKYGRIWYDF